MLSKHSNFLSILVKQSLFIFIISFCQIIRHHRLRFFLFILRFLLFPIPFRFRVHLKTSKIRLHKGNTSLIKTGLSLNLYEFNLLLNRIFRINQLQQSKNARIDQFRVNFQSFLIVLNGR